MKSLHLLPATLLPLLISSKPLTSPKRGLCHVETQYSSSDDPLFTKSPSDLTWYYNYKSTPSPSIPPSVLPFIPMLWSPSSDPSFFTTVKSLLSTSPNSIPAVLAFNEPNNCAGNTGGSCLDAKTAAEAWVDQIQPLKDQFPDLKLGSPAVTSAENGFTWMQNWFAECAGRCKPDFIATHFYGSFEALASHVGRVNATYHNVSSIWVTEFNLPNATLGETQGFYNASVGFLDKLEYVQRYALFGAFRSDVSNVGPNAAMLDQRGQLTDIGAWYLGEQATGNIPKASGASGRKVANAFWTLSLIAVCYFMLG